ncbi:DNA-binding transcriptional regulator, XRE-family HTH domain [Nitrosomonas aestuarii]|uniref:DNA-binding transcriptional regulator, XRE-family HTH domain n=1 Tax=Nitrosomonas aestuarii TaxID=52441 RepID=A0A1I4H5J6_9PROT|nr:helix-turn-helix domain-containing protein [Nitrosomonas aestuarii]SFL36923.1 DNA-binding transcriptional regulator, XRE-family HTH domain [Nitrosomonas aestuarii]
MSTDRVYNLILITNILRVLEEKGMTKAELAEKAGVSGSFFIELSNNKANPSLRIIAAIADALELPLPMLLDDSDVSKEVLKAITNQGVFKFPGDLVWQGGVLNKYQAFQVLKWSDDNKKLLKRNK